MLVKTEMLVKIESVLRRRKANSADEQDVDKVLAFISEKARRKVFQSKKFLTSAVYTFILTYFMMISSIKLTNKRKVLLC